MIVLPQARKEQAIGIQHKGRLPEGHLHVQDKVPQGTLLTPETLQQENRLNAFSVSADGVSFVAGSAAIGPTDGWRWLRWEYLAPPRAWAGF